MNYWMNLDGHWIMCFRGVEIPLKAKPPMKCGVEDASGAWILEWWEPWHATLVDDASRDDMSVFYSWVAECLVEPNCIPVVLCNIDPETKEELEIWCIRDARIENFECHDDPDNTMTFNLDFTHANQFKEGA